MIRYAKTSDLPELIELGTRLKDQTVYADVPIDIATVGQTLGQCISNAFGLALVAEHDGKINGLLLGVAVPLWYSRKRSASDLITYAETAGDGFRMIRKFVNWAWSIPNVIDVTLSQSSGIEMERTGTLYERLGLQKVGSLYTAVRQEQAAEVAA